MSSSLTVTVSADSAGNAVLNAVKQLTQQPNQTRLMAFVPERKKRHKTPAEPGPITPSTERLMHLGVGFSRSPVLGDRAAKVGLVWPDDHEVRLSPPHVNRSFGLDQAEHCAEGLGVHGTYEDPSELFIARLERCVVTEEERSAGGVMPDFLKWPGVNS